MLQRVGWIKEGEGKVHRITHSECECRAFFHARKRHACFLPTDTKERKGCKLKNVYRIKSSERPPFQWQSCLARGTLTLTVSAPLQGPVPSLAKFPTMHSSCCLPSSLRLSVPGWSHLFPTLSAFCGSLTHECEAMEEREVDPCHVHSEVERPKAL